MIDITLKLKEQIENFEKSYDKNDINYIMLFIDKIIIKFVSVDFNVNEVDFLNTALSSMVYKMLYSKKINSSEYTKLDKYIESIVKCMNCDANDMFFNGMRMLYRSSIDNKSDINNFLDLSENVVISAIWECIYLSDYFKSDEFKSIVDSRIVQSVESRNSKELYKCLNILTALGYTNKDGYKEYIASCYKRSDNKTNLFN